MELKRLAGLAVVLVAACGGAAKPLYPTAACTAAGSCGRVTTLGYLGSGEGGEFFVDLEKKDASGSSYAYRVSCSGCPFVVGKTYRARMTTDQPWEHVFSILGYGGEITNPGVASGRTDGLTVSHIEVYKCGEADETPPLSHWIMKEGWPTCTLGADPTAWVEDTFPEIPGCERGWMQGLMWAGVSEVSILIRLASDYELEDPQLAHDMFPQVFVAALNTRGPHRDNGVADGTGIDWKNADGPPNYFFDVTFQMDSTGDHYGMTVSVSGPRDRATLMSGGEAVPLFSYTIPPVYTSAEELTRASANAAYERLYFGWTCDTDGSHPVKTMEQECAAFEAERQANMAANPGFYEGLTCGS